MGQPESSDINVRRAVHTPPIWLLFDAYLAGDIAPDDAVDAIKRHVRAITREPELADLASL